MANGKFGSKEVLDCTLYDMATNVPVISFDTLKTSSIEVTSDKVEAKGGKGNATLLTWELNKTAKMTIEDALLSPKSLELVSGVARQVGTQTIHMRQKTEWTADANPVDKGSLFPLVCNATSGIINLAYAPLEGATKILVYIRENDCETPVDMTGATLTGKTLTLGTGGKTEAGGKKVIVYYTYTSGAQAEAYVIDSEHFAGTYKLVGDTVVKNASTGKNEAFQIVIPNIKMSSALNLNFSADGDPSVQSFECDIQRDANSSTMIQMIKY